MLAVFLTICFLGGFIFLVLFILKCLGLVSSWLLVFSPIFVYIALGVIELIIRYIISFWNYLMNKSYEKQKIKVMKDF